MSVSDSVREVRPSRGVLVGTYSNYGDAQRAVDRLSDARFPVEHIQIVGRDLTIVEDVTGRMTKARAAATGAWFGLFIGLLVGLFTTGPEWLGLVRGGLLIGAFWGAVFGFVAHWATRGMRDFASLRGLAAASYDVLVDEEHADRARSLLASAT
jgi:MFS family permease